MKKMAGFCGLIAAVLMFCGCSSETKNEYQQISQEEAMRMMEKDDGHVIVDVRTRSEFEEAHIPDAINIPNEEITDTAPKELPDLSQVILVYCRSGNRSKDAAAKLAKIGYTNIYEFGGIMTWTGKTVSENREALQLRFTSFAGGGPEYRAVIEDPSVISVRMTTEEEQSEEPIDGGSIDYYFFITGITAGETKLTIEERSPIAGNYDHVYQVTVDQDLKAEVRELTTSDLDAMTDVTAAFAAGIGTKTYYPVTEDNPSMQQLKQKLYSEMLTLEMEDKDACRKSAELPWTLEGADEAGTASAGDIILSGGTELSICYESYEGDFIHLARLDSISQESLRELLGKGNTAVSFWLEWSE